MIWIQIMTGKQWRSKSIGFFRSQLIWIYTVCKGRIYPGSGRQVLKQEMSISSAFLIPHASRNQNVTDGRTDGQWAYSIPHKQFAGVVINLSNYGLLHIFPLSSSHTHALTRAYVLVTVITANSLSGVYVNFSFNDFVFFLSSKKIGRMIEQKQQWIKYNVLCTITYKIA